MLELRFDPQKRCFIKPLGILTLLLLLLLLARWLMCLPLLIFPCTIKTRSSLLAPSHPGGCGKRAVKRLCVCVAFCRCFTCCSPFVLTASSSITPTRPRRGRILASSSQSRLWYVLATQYYTVAIGIGDPRPVFLRNLTVSGWYRLTAAELALNTQ